MQARTKAEALEQIKADLKCSQFLEHGKNDRKDGSMYICPFCGSGKGKEGTGALKVYPTNSWYCHACNKSGDVLDLIQQVYGLDFNGAFEKAADMTGIQYGRAGTLEGPRTNFKAVSVHKQDENEKTQGTADYGVYFVWCQKRLNDTAAISYLEGRGISLETAKVAGIGFDPEADPASAPGAAAGEKKLHPTARIIIPTTKAHYVGRAIDPNIEKRYAKLNPSREKGAGEPGIFNAAAIYNPQRHSDDPVFVVEGAFDALSVCEVGRYAIALNSTANTEKLIAMLQEKPAASDTAFIVAFDNDRDERTAERTRTAAEGLTERLNALGYKSITADIAGQNKDANEALQANREKFRSLVDTAVKGVKADYLSDFWEKIQTNAYKPCKTGLSFWDDLMCGGVEDQQLIILMAAPGTGKTTLCQQLAEEMAASHKPCIYLNLEMSREQMLSKALSYHLAASGKAWLSSREILHGYEWTPEQKRLIDEAMKEYRQKYYPWIKYATIGNDLDNILEYLEKAGKAATERGEKAPAVILDYLHLVGTSRKMDVQELIKATVTGLKRYAIKYNTFVVLISATGRSSTGRINLSSGRDSSNIEYTGDIVLSLDYYAVDKGTVDASKAKEMASLTDGVKWRQMILRGLKGRFFASGGEARLWFNSRCNYFLGENDWRVGDVIDELPEFEIDYDTASTRSKGKWI